MTMIDDPEAIRLMQLFTQIQALKLEIKGMRHSSGRSMSAYLKQTLGIKGSRERVLEQAQAIYSERRAAWNAKNGRTA